MTIPIPGDTYDPCATYIELRTAYLGILKGQGAKRVRFRNGEEERETEFNSTNLEALRAAMKDAEAECQLTLGGRSRRSAIGIGRLGPQIKRIY